MSRLSRFTALVVCSLVLCAPAPAPANEPVALNGYAVELIDRGEFEKGLELLQRAFSLNSYDENLKRNLAEAYVNVGRHQMERNLYEDAAASFANARELFPETLRYTTLRGIALYFAKQYDAAALELERARNSGSHALEVFFFLGKVRYDTGDLTAALEAWDKALSIEPGNANIRELAEKARREAAVEGGMGKGYSSRFTISYDTEAKSDLADSILDNLERAYNRVGSDLDHFPTARIPVILYTQKDYRSVTTGPDWSGGLYDGKIRLPLRGATDVNEVLRGILFHEYTHVVIRELTHGNCPTWLNEGIAELEGRKEQNPPLRELPKAVKSGTLHPLSRLEGSFLGLPGKDALLAYEESYSLVNFMISAYGWNKIRDILVSLGAGLPVSAAVAKGLTDYGLDYPRVEAEWREYLLKEMGRNQ